MRLKRNKKADLLLIVFLDLILPNRVIVLAMSAPGRTASSQSGLWRCRMASQNTIAMHPHYLCSHQQLCLSLL